MSIFCAVAAHAQLVVTVSSPKITGQKAVVLLSIKNDFGQPVDSARAAVFLLDGEGKMVAQSTKWVIGGTKDKPGLASGATNSFFFVLKADKPLPGTNFTTRVNFSRVVLEGGRLVDPAKEILISNSK